MPRKPAQTPPAVTITISEPKPIELKGRARELFEEVSSRWRLDAVASSILTCACESLQRAQEAAEIATREGMTVRTRLGEVRVHPAAKLEMDHRAAAANALQKLGLNLQ